MMQSIGVKLSRYFICTFLLMGSFAKPAISSSPKVLRTIYIYNDIGTSKAGVQNCKDAIHALNPRLYVAKEINAEQTISGEWRKDAVAFLMPGGADLPYCKKLNGKGNAQIKEYVETGGAYIGFCAGAYYGSHYCEFHKGDTRGYEVLGERGLSFFPGSAVGPVLAPYDYASKLGSRVAKIQWLKNTEIYNVYFNGGCYFKDANQYPNVQILAHYNNKGFEGRAAIVECHVGKGKALLSGVHPESSVENLSEMKDISPKDALHFKNNIFPGLSDGSHIRLFAMLIGRI